MSTDLLALIDTERSNIQDTTKFLGESVHLTGDLEAVYELIVKQLDNPRVGESDERLAFFAVLNQLMVSRMLLTKGIFAVLKMYQGEALGHLRKAIEMVAFAVRISKHPELGKVWAEAGTDKDEDKDQPKYKAYRKAFKTYLIFPDEGEADYDPILKSLHRTWELSSKPMHGSIIGVAGHIGNIRESHKEDGKRYVAFFDMQYDFLQSMYFKVLLTHLMILQLFGQILERFMNDREPWKKEYDYANQKVSRHMLKWLPVIAQNAAGRAKAKPKVET